MAAESLSRRAFPHHPQLWRVWSRDAAPTPQVAGRTLGGYLFVPIELALVAAFYYATNRWLGWWQPSEVLTDPEHPRRRAVPALDADRDLAAGGLHGGVRVSRDSAVARRADRRALRPAHARHRDRVRVQALVFGGAHANYPGLPVVFAAGRARRCRRSSGRSIFLRFGLLPTILLHATFDLTLFSIPLFLVDAPGARLQQALVIAAALVPLAIVAWRRRQAGAWRELPAALRNGAWRRGRADDRRAAAPRQRRRRPRVARIPARAAGARRRRRRRVGSRCTPFRADVPPLALDRATTRSPRPTPRSPRAASRSARNGGASPRVKLASDDARAVDVAQVRLARGGRRRVSRACRHDARAAAVGSALRDVRRRRRRARRGMARRRSTDDGAVRTMRAHAAGGAAGRAPDARRRARARASARCATRFGVDPAPLKLVAADEQQRPARTDWSFVFGDPRIDVGAGGEARYIVAIGGDEVSGAGRFVHRARNVDARRTRARQAAAGRRTRGGVVFFAAGLAALVVGILGWIRHRVDTRRCAIVFGATFVIARAVGGERVAAVAMRLSTTEPIASQLTTQDPGRSRGRAARRVGRRSCARVSARSARG